MTSNERAVLRQSILEKLYEQTSGNPNAEIDQSELAKSAGIDIQLAADIVSELQTRGFIRYLYIGSNTISITLDGIREIEEKSKEPNQSSPAPAQINIINNVHNLQLQQGSPGASQSISTQAPVPIESSWINNPWIINIGGAVIAGLILAFLLWFLTTKVFSSSPPADPPLLEYSSSKVTQNSKGTIQWAINLINSGKSRGRILRHRLLFGSLARREGVDVVFRSSPADFFENDDMNDFGLGPLPWPLMEEVTGPMQVNLQRDKLISEIVEIDYTELATPKPKCFTLHLATQVKINEVGQLEGVLKKNIPNMECVNYKTPAEIIPIMSNR